jgi:hypothetical protein
MSGKKLNTDAITSELAGSAFFPMRPTQNRQEKQPSKTAPVAVQDDPIKPQPQVTGTRQSATKPIVKPLRAPHVTARPYVRRTFDLYEDQLAYLTRASLEDRLAGGEGSMNAMVREALDAFIQKRKSK